MIVNKKPKRSAGRKKSSEPERPLAAVVANARGEIFDLHGFAAVGRDGGRCVVLSVPETIGMPSGGELMYLPDRMPLVYDLTTGRLTALAENPHKPGEAIYPVAGFNSPGYVIACTSAYEERPGAGLLPLFSYGAVGWHAGRFRSPVIQVDAEPRQDLRLMPPAKISAGVRRMQRELPGNRLREHLERCALTYGCPAGKNFFLGRYEAPLPAATACNARCLGCISLQSEGRISASQNRIAFTPTAREIADVALAHIGRVDKAIVSFGQGCEGDPLTVSDTIAEAIALIRAATPKGTINMNTNGSLPPRMAQLLDAGLDSARISMNSVRKPCYEAYFRPRGYGFEDVAATIDLLIARGAHVAINYLNCPGFTDTPEERDALLSFLRRHPVNMIQWRNLNFDPLRYVRSMEGVGPHSAPIGMRSLLEEVRRAFPRLRYGYFNPPKEDFRPLEPPSPRIGAR